MLYRWIVQVLTDTPDGEREECFEIETRSKRLGTAVIYTKAALFDKKIHSDDKIHVRIWLKDQPMRSYAFDRIYW